jgi:hypothetical protein
MRPLNPRSRADMERFFDLFDTYHPELHYMRGPGPKWHAKHGASTQPFSN